MSADPSSSRVPSDDALTAFLTTLQAAASPQQQTETLDEFSAAIQAESDPSVCFSLSATLPPHHALTTLLVSLLSTLSSQPDLSVAACKALVALSFSDGNNRVLLRATGLEPALTTVLQTTAPSETTLRYNPKLDSSALGALMADPQAGLQGMMASRQAALQAQEHDLPPEQLAERHLFSCWQLLRRYTTLFLRNLAKAPISSPPTSSDGQATLDGEAETRLAESQELVAALVAPLTSAHESGEIVYHAVQALRFLLEGGGGAMMAERMAQSAETLLSIMGCAMTSRVVRKPNGEGLWVHFEATRLVVALVQRAAGCRGLLLEKHGCRAVANLVNGTKASLVHLEGLRALRLLVGCREDAAAVLMQQSSTARHVIMSCLTALAAPLVHYQQLADPSAPLTAELLETVDLLSHLLALLLKTPGLPDSEDGSARDIINSHSGSVVIQAFAQRFPETAPKLLPLLS